MSEQTKKNLVTAKVVSKKADKTAIVEVVRSLKHKLYEKYIKRTTRLAIHDAENTSKEGDLVLIQECRPISKTKAWKLVEILERAPGN